MLTDEQRDEIVRRYTAGDLVKVIAADFGTYASFVSHVAKLRGCPTRYPRKGGPFSRGGALKVLLRPQEQAELKKLAKEQRVRPEIIAREAISAYLGLIR